jgi:hypothetical protein
MPVKIHAITNYMKQSGPWESDSRSSSQEVSRFPWNWGGHYRVLSCRPLDTVCTLVPYNFKIRFNIISHLPLGLPSCLFLVCFPTTVWIVHRRFEHWHGCSALSLPTAPHSITFRSLGVTMDLILLAQWLRLVKLAGPVRHVIRCVSSGSG